MNQDIRHIINHDWITFIVISCFLLIALIKYRYPRKFEDFVLIISSDKFLSGSVHNNRLTHPFNLVLLVVQWISVALFIYIGYCYYTDIGIGQSPIIYLYILAGYILFEQVKLGLERFIGFIIDFSAISKPYTYRKVVYKNFLSLLVFLFCIVLAFRNPFLREYYAWFLGIVVLIYLISLVLMLRKFQSVILNRPSYFILYFCTLEIAPYYILYKVFI